MCCESQPSRQRGRGVCVTAEGRGACRACSEGCICQGDRQQKRKGVESSLGQQKGLLLWCQCTPGGPRCVGNLPRIRWGPWQKDLAWRPWGSTPGVHLGRTKAKVALSNRGVEGRVTKRPARRDISTANKGMAGKGFSAWKPISKKSTKEKIILKHLPGQRKLRSDKCWSNKTLPVLCLSFFSPLQLCSHQNLEQV